MVLTISSSEWAEVPELIGASLYLQQLHELAKGAGHKYIRRVPYTTAAGKRSYRYFYNVRGGKGAGHEDEIKTGAKFRIKHGEHEGHFHVEDVKGDRVQVVHDESGHSVWMTKAAFSEMIREEHAEAIKEHHGAVRKEHKATTVRGMKKQVEKRAKKYGIRLVLPAEKEEPESSEKKRLKTPPDPPRTGNINTDPRAYIAAAQKQISPGDYSRGAARLRAEIAFHQALLDGKSLSEAHEAFNSKTDASASGPQHLEETEADARRFGLLPSKKPRKPTKPEEPPKPKLGHQDDLHKKNHPAAVGRSEMDSGKSYTLWQKVGERWVVERTMGGGHIKGDDSYWEGVEGRAGSSRPLAFFPQGTDPNAVEEPKKISLAGGKEQMKLRDTASGKLGAKLNSMEREGWRVAPAPKDVKLSELDMLGPLPLGKVKDLVDAGVILIRDEKPAAEPKLASEDEIPMATAVAAFSGTSHTPERRAEQVRKDYVEHVRDVEKKLAKHAKTDEQKAQLRDEMAQYKKGYRQRFLSWLGSRAGLMSTMIAGGSKFPAVQQRKKSAASDRKGQDLTEWSDKAIKRIRNKIAPVSISADREDATTLLQQKIDKAVKLQATMKATNRIVRSKKLSDDQKVAKLAEIGVKEASARRILTPDRWGKVVGFESYQLTNNNANIKRMKQRVAQLEKEASTETLEHDFDGGVVSDNVHENRVEIHFDGRPTPDMIQKLKSEGFKWAPSKTAWQRLRNDNARAAAERLTGAPVWSSVNKSMSNLTSLIAPAAEDGWMEIPTSLGERFWKAYQHDLYKAVGHKYIRRVPYTDSKGRQRYRYFYAVTGKRGIGHAEEIKERSAFKIEHDGKEGHFHVEKVDGDKVTVKHDESGETVTMTKDELRDMLHKEHAELIEAHRERTTERRERERKSVEKKGREKYKAAHLKRWEAYTEKYSWLSAGGIFTHADSDVPWTPDESPAIQLHHDLMPEKTVKFDKETLNFPNPKGKKQKLFPHQSDGGERAWTAFKEGHGMLCQDDAGLGKTLTGISALYHGMQHEGVKRALICVPGKGKSGIKNQWKGDAALYGIKVRDADQDREGMAEGDGVWSVAYDHHEFYETVEETNWDEEREEYVTKKVIELKPWLKDFDMIIMDESHNLAGTSKPGEMSNIAKAGVKMHGQVKDNKVLYLSATPFTNVRDMHYLRALGWFKTGAEFMDWAVQAGCSTDPGTMGDVPAKINNPTSSLPMVQIAAVSHVDGTSIKRTTSLEGLSSNFHDSTLEDLIDIPEHITKKHPELSNIYLDAVKTFELAEEMFDVAQAAGYGMALAAQKTNWRKSYWETLKVVEAIKMGETALLAGKQIGFFTNYHQYSNSIIGGAGPEKGLSKTFRDRAEEAAEMGDWDEVEKNTDAAVKLEELAKKLPPSTNPVDILVAHFGGPSKVAEAHGRTSKKLIAEQDAFQKGHKQVMVGTMAKAGTGLSWHDDEGIAARVQCNLGLPWTGTAFTQVSGRMHRLGSLSDTEMFWLLGDNDTEKRNAATVAARLRSMGALVSGDPDMAVDAAQLAAFETGLDVSAEDLMGELLNVDIEGDESAEDASKKQKKKEAKKKKGQTLEGQEARDHFRSYAESRHAGHDVLAEEHEKRKQRKLKTIRHSARKIGAALAQYGVSVGPHSDPEKFRVFAKGYDSRKELRRNIGRIRKGKESNQHHGDYTVTIDALLKVAEKYNVQVGGRTGILSEEEFADSMNPSRLTQDEISEIAHRKELREYKTAGKQGRKMLVHPDDRRRAEGVGLEVEKSKVVVGAGKDAKYLVDVYAGYDAARWRPMIKELAASDPVAKESQPKYAYNKWRIPAGKLDEMLTQMESGSTVDPKPVKVTRTPPTRPVVSPPPAPTPEPKPAPAPTPVRKTGPATLSERQAYVSTIGGLKKELGSLRDDKGERDPRWYKLSMEWLEDPVAQGGLGDHKDFQSHIDKFQAVIDEKKGRPSPVPAPSPIPTPTAGSLVRQRARKAGITLGDPERRHGKEVVLVTGDTRAWKENIKDHAKRGGLSPKLAWDRDRTGWLVPTSEVDALVAELETGTPKAAPKRTGGYRGRRSYFRRGMPDNVRFVIHVPRG